MNKRIMRGISQLLAAAVVTGGLIMNTVPVQAATVKDLDKTSSYAKEAVEWMVSNNVITGDNKGYFNPGKKISRAELVTLLVKALGIDASNLPAKATFKDVPANHWAFRYVEAASRAGITSGTGNGIFGVDEMCTREQASTMILNYLSVAKEAVLADQGLKDLAKFMDEGKMSDWAKPAIQFAVANKIMSGVKTDKFSPEGTATKEQFATILYNFKKSENSIMQKAAELRKPIVIYNGDILNLSVAPEIINGEVMVPSNVFGLTGSDVNIDAQTGNTVIKNHTNPDKNIYFSTGNQTAYVNYTGSGNPFNDPAAQDKKLVLQNAPQAKENDVLVPVKAVADAMGLSLEWNTTTNLVTLKDSTAVKNPVLYNALKGMLQFKGEYQTNMEMIMKEDVSQEEMGFSYTMSGAINGPDSTSKTRVTMSFPGYPAENFDYETVYVDGKLYSKNTDTGEWSNITLEDAAYEGIPYYDNVASSEEIQTTLDLYDSIKVIPLGKVVLNGEEVMKYQLNMDFDILNEFIPEGILPAEFGLEDVYNNGFDYKYDIYVNKQGQLVRQNVSLSAGMTEEGYSISFNVTSNANFSKIGENIEIVKPM